MEISLHRVLAITKYLIYLGGSLGDCGKEESPLLLIQFLAKFVSM
jgi:hypothetical protein